MDNLNINQNIIMAFIRQRVKLQYFKAPRLFRIGTKFMGKL